MKKIKSNLMKQKWSLAKKAGVKNLAQLKKRGKDIFPPSVCQDCEQRPTFTVSQIGFSTEKKFCNRHFYLFSQKFIKWFLEDIL